MPVIRKLPSTSSGHDELVERLVNELRTPALVGQPLILENTVGDTDHFNVYVIWDRWKGLPQASRQRVIRSSYQQLDLNRWSKVPIAMGLTYREAIEEGVLPVRLVPWDWAGEGSALPDGLPEAMIAEGAIAMPDGQLELRFPTHEAAEEAFRRLHGKFGNHLRLIEEVPRDDLDY
jgi:hypothetical protein